MGKILNPGIGTNTQYWYQYCCFPNYYYFLTTLQTQYGNPMIYVTENGVSEKMLCTDLCDDWRMKYYKDYINEMLKGENPPPKTLLSTLCLFCFPALTVLSTSCLAWQLSRTV